ncbi:MAG: EFR1 family ferrodoxin [Oscillospiraceae bacterium]
MKTEKVTAIYFSPTGGTKAVCEEIAAKLAGGAVESMDLTVEAQSAAFGAQDVVVIAAPVFGGRVPSPTRDRLAALSAEGSPAIVVAVYGNRAYEDALLELKSLAESRGFKVVAAGAFIARHSIMPEYGAGRPDASDKAIMARFAESVRQKLADAAEAAALPEISVPGNRPYRKFDGLPMNPTANKLKCGKCGKCAQNCPVGAIPLADPLKTDAKKCITCMRCASLCPHYARCINPALLIVAKAKLKKECSERKEPEMFL